MATSQENGAQRIFLRIRKYGLMWDMFPSQQWTLRELFKDTKRILEEDKEMSTHQTLPSAMYLRINKFTDTIVIYDPYEVVEGQKLTFGDLKHNHITLDTKLVDFCDDITQIELKVWSDKRVQKEVMFSALKNLASSLQGQAPS